MKPSNRISDRVGRGYPEVVGIGLVIGVAVAVNKKHHRALLITLSHSINVLRIIISCSLLPSRVDKSRREGMVEICSGARRKNTLRHGVLS